MTDFLVKRYIPNYDDVNNPQVRKSYGMLSGGVGVCVNVVLCIMKLAAGFLSGSLGIIGDGINNLSDAGSSIVTIFGLRLSAKPADAEHPYGHGRIEYIAAMIVAGVIFMVGFELILTSISKLMEPEPVEVSMLSIGVMAVSVLAKLWLGQFNQSLGDRINSPVFHAVAADSRSDCVATGVVILCLLLYSITGYDLDGIAGIVVGGFIMYSGWTAAAETLQPILGEPADPDMIHSIIELALQDKRIIGVHDVTAHSYGPGNVFAAVHIEVPSTMTLIRAHFVATHLEYMIEKYLNVKAVVHVDPKVVGNARYDAIEASLNEILHDIDPRLHMHDFHIIHDRKLVFDVEVPYSFPMEDGYLESLINSKLKEQEALYEAVVKLDRV